MQTMGIMKEARMPFRLDLVMGGVSDLDFWADRKGECLSLACNISGKAIQMQAVLLKEKYIQLEGFGKETLYYKISDIDHLKISHIKSNIQMIMAALHVALTVVQNAGIIIRHGFYIKNSSLRQKGMGGSSVVATTIIALLCSLYDAPIPSINEMISFVAEAERLCGSNGGWEDVAGSYFSRISHVKYRPALKDKLCIESPHINENCFNTLQDSILLVDSNINASTGKILAAAYNNYLKDQQGIVLASETIRNECNKVLQALQQNDMEHLGQSLTIQRKQWGMITGGLSLSPEVDKILTPLEGDIYGYREAGAGGGGTIIIVCKEEKKNTVSNWMQHKGIKPLPWRISDYGLEVY